MSPAQAFWAQSGLLRAPSRPPQGPAPATAFTSMVLQLGSPDRPPEEYVAGPKGSLLLAAPDRHGIKYAMRDLDPIPDTLKDIVYRTGARVLVVGGGASLHEVFLNGRRLVRDPNARSTQQCYGLYSPRWNMMLVREWRVGTYTLCHEFGHALDQALDTRGTYSLALWNRFSNRQGFVRPYAGTNHKEYFADSFAAMFSAHDRAFLRAIDAPMEALLTRLLDVTTIDEARRLRFA